MDKKPTFQEQYNKITSAYYKNELDPFEECACFVGNLLNRCGGWSFIRDFSSASLSINLGQTEYGQHMIFQHSEGLYSKQDILQLENNFIEKCFPDKTRNFLSNKEEATEENLFSAMESTLEMLRKIHEGKGEIIQDCEFHKRELCII